MDNQANQQKQPSYAFCIYCGKKYVVGDKFCQNCGKKIEIAAPPSPEEMKKRQYDQAVALFNAHRYDEAQKIFTQLADYNDSKDKAQECVTAKENAAKEQVYVSCIAYLTKPKISEAELKSAIERLKAIESYKDSKDKIAGLEKRLNMWYEAKKAAEQAALKKQYDTALAHLNSGLFDKAVAEFTALGDYSDAKAQIKNCYAAKENARKAQLYSSAVAVITAQNATEDMIKASIESLKSIPDFKDSKDKIKEVEARLEKFYADKALAKKKKRRRTAISLVIVFLLALIAGAIIFATTPFVITYNLDGGSIDPKISRSYTLLTDDYALPTPTKDGYIFKGWTGTGLSSPTQDVTIKRFSFGNRSYTANWEAGKYTVQFYVNGGTGVYNAKTLAYGDTFNIPEPTREGYAFMGWASPTAVYNNGDTWLETENVSLAAMWSANQYTITFEDIYAIADDITVTFDLNYFMSDASIHTLNNGDRINYPNTPVRAGYLFTGWYLDSNCTNEYAFQGNITGDMTLYAGWKQVSATNDYYYPWSFSGNVITSTNHSHSSTSEYTITVSEDTTVSFQYKVSSESGCDVFRIMKNGVDIITASGNSYDTYTDFSVDLVAGDTLTFRYSKDGSANNGTDTAYICNLSTATKYESTAVVRNENVYSYEYRLGETATMTVTYGEEFILPDPARRGYSLLNWRCNGTVIESGIWNMTYDITLTPEWEMGRNVITLNPDGGTVANTTVTVRFEQSYTLPTPTKTGYTFLGWYMGNTKYEGGVWRGLDNITLTARWSANNYTVTFDDTDEMTSNVVVTLNYNYSGATNSTVTLTNGQTLSYPTPPTRSGYAFAGWYTNSSCTTQYSFSGTITQNMTLYAKWTSMTSSYNSREYVNIASYTTSSSKKSVTINASSSSSQNYYYFTCYKTGTYTIYTAYTSGDFYVEVYNVTRSTTIMSRTNLYSGNISKSTSFSANAGDVIYVRLYKYSSSGSTGYGTFYVTGAGYPTSTATASCATVSHYAYDTSSQVTVSATYGSTVTLPTPVRAGYTFLGWYNGETKVESGTWTIASNVTLTPRWQ